MSDDIRILWEAQVSVANSAWFYLPAAGSVLLQCSQVTGTLHQTQMFHSPISANDTNIWTKIGESATAAETMLVVPVPGGRILFRLSSNNGTVDGVYAVHYGRG